MKKKHLRKIFKFIIFSLCIVFLKTYNINAQTDIQAGEVSGTWSSQNSPYRIFGEISIPDQETLTIEPGTNIEFQGHYKFNVQGRLLAIGNVNDSITFTIHDTTGFSDTSIIGGGWHGFKFDLTPPTNDTSKFIYCKIQYGKAVGNTINENAGGAFYVNDFSKLVIKHSNLKNNLALTYGGAIYCINYSSPIISENIFYFNTVSKYYGGAIYCKDFSSMEISGNVFSYNYARLSGAAIYCGDYCTTMIKNNLITYNSVEPGHSLCHAGGIHSSSWDYNDPTIVNNVICNNSFTGIYESNRAIKIANNIICNNSGFGIYNGHQLGNGQYVNNTICNNILEAIGCNTLNLKVYNNILWGNNNEEDSSQIDNWDGELRFVDYNVIQNGYAGEENLTQNPSLIAPSEGAGTEYDGVNADWNMQLNSNCINSGNPDTASYYYFEIDIAGNPRISGDNIDIGACEKQIEGGIFNYYTKSKHHIRTVYPNPCKKYLNLKIDNLDQQEIRIKIINTFGKIIRIINIRNTEDKYSIQIDVSDLSSGIYFVELEKNNFLECVKFIVK